MTNNSNREITTTNTNSIRRTLEAGELHKSYDIRSEQRTYSRDIAIANDVPFNDIEQVSRLIEENPIIDQNHADASTENLGTRYYENETPESHNQDATAQPSTKLYTPLDRKSVV